MRKVSLFTAAIMLAALTSSGAFAADEAKPGHKIREACKSDVEKFCAGVERHKGKIRACLEEHVADLQEGCSTAIKGLPAKAAQ